MTLYYVLVFCGLAATEFVKARGDRRALIVWCALYALSGVLGALWLGGVSF